MSNEQVRVRFDEKVYTISLTKQGFLSVKALQRVFEGATSLTYKKNDENILVEHDEDDDDKIIIDDKVEIYDAFFPKGIVKIINFSKLSCLSFFSFVLQELIWTIDLFFIFSLCTQQNVFLSVRCNLDTSLFCTKGLKTYFN